LTSHNQRSSGRKNYDAFYPFRSFAFVRTRTAGHLRGIRRASRHSGIDSDRPPELPIYEQPICPVDGYLWTPGYWAYADEDYYWVPGTWVSAPEVGYLWTPGYWSGDGDDYIFHEGYWGTEVGFYGGISYGYGYFGHGYEGGRWDNGHFAYNQSVSRVNVSINHNVYNTG
jgi:hypothetical protein